MFGFPMFLSSNLLHVEKVTNFPRQKKHKWHKLQTSVFSQVVADLTQREVESLNTRQKHFPMTGASGHCPVYAHARSQWWEVTDSW